MQTFHAEPGTVSYSEVMSVVSEVRPPVPLSNPWPTALCMA
jgi:hypothetical protein